jgi:hypothetical protein
MAPLLRTSTTEWESQWSTAPALATNTPAAALILYANQTRSAGWNTTTDTIALATAMAVYVQ